LENVTSKLQSLSLEEDPLIAERSEKLIEATLHIKQADAQRKLANQKLMKLLKINTCHTMKKDSVSLQTILKTWMCPTLEAINLETHIIFLL
jgi:hypothetical protein